MSVTSQAILQKRIKKSIRKFVENSARFGENMTGQASSWSGNYIHDDNDLDFFLEPDSTNNSTRLTELRSGDDNLAATIRENFFYQHIFNFALVSILILQACVVWAFIMRRLSKSPSLDRSGRHGGVVLIDMRNPRLVEASADSESEDEENEHPLDLDLVAGMLPGRNPPTPRSGRFG